MEVILLNTFKPSCVLPFSIKEKIKGTIKRRKSNINPDSLSDFLEMDLLNTTTNKSSDPPNPNQAARERVIKRQIKKDPKTPAKTSRQKRDLVSSNVPKPKGKTIIRKAPK
jgi:hypothetical protein